MDGGSVVGDGGCAGAGAAADLDDLLVLEREAPLNPGDDGVEALVVSAEDDGVDVVLAGGGGEVGLVPAYEEGLEHGRADLGLLIIG